MAKERMWIKNNPVDFLCPNCMRDGEICLLTPSFSGPPPVGIGCCSTRLVFPKTYTRKRASWEKRGRGEGVRHGRGKKENIEEHFLSFS